MAGSRPWSIAIGLVLVVVLAVIVLWNRGPKSSKRIESPAVKVSPSAVVVRDMDFSPKARPFKTPVAAFPVVRSTVQVVQPVQTFPKVIKPVALPVVVTSAAVPGVPSSTIKKGSYKIS